MSYRLPLQKLLMAASALLLTAQITVADNSQAIERGKAQAAMCSACHQPNGGGMNIPGGESWPRLAGLNADYLVEQIKAFKQGTRKSPSMTPFANMLASDAQMQDVSLYYASLAAPATNYKESDSALLSHGKQLAEQGDWNRYIVSCSRCHGKNNQGVGTVFPGIAGQHAGYIEQQLKAWQQGDRSNDPQHLMASIAQRLNDNDIKAVAAWLATQAPSKQQGDKR